jgi:hypothetical protein
MEKGIVQLGQICDIKLTSKLAISNQDKRNDDNYHVAVQIVFSFADENAKQSKFAEHISKLPENLRLTLQKVSGSDETFHTLEFCDLMLDEGTVKSCWPDQTRPATNEEQIALRDKLRECLKIDGKYISYPFTVVNLDARDVLAKAGVTKGLREGKEIEFSSIYSIERKRGYSFFYRARFGERSSEYIERVYNNLLSKNVDELLKRSDFCPDSVAGWDEYDKLTNQKKATTPTLRTPETEPDDSMFDN